MELPSSSQPVPPGGNASNRFHDLSAGAYAGAGRYELKRLLGTGGMGIVWLAKDLRLGEDAALKFLPREIGADPSALDDMRRETLKSRKLSHPNIIRIHDLFESPDEAPFISMEYVDGPNLSTLRLQQPERIFSWDYLKPLVQQLCEALDYAHGEGVIHRDLKPANMMLDSRGRLKLADFGIAATLSESGSRVSVKHQTSGTMTYMSPQQMDGEVPKVTDDIYALGATLYELLTSKPPFYSGDILHQVRNLPAKPIAERLWELSLSNAIPADVASMVMACLAKDPSQRPPSARIVAQWIGLTWGDSAPQIKFGEESTPVAADSVTENLTNAPSRWPAKLWLSGFVGAAVIAVLIFGWYAVTKLRPVKSPLDAFWNGQSEWVLDSTVSGLPSQFPSILSEESGLVAYYSGLESTGGKGETKIVSVIKRAQSGDGISWKNTGKILTAGVVRWVYPSVFALHKAGRADQDGWSAKPGRDAPEHMAFGPYKSFPPGSYTATFHLMIDQHAGKNDDVGYVDVCHDGRSIIITGLKRHDFTNDLTYQDFNLHFQNKTSQPLEFRTSWSGHIYLREDYVALMPLSGPDRNLERACVPSGWQKEGVSYLVYEGAEEFKGDLCLATSTNGTDFVPFPKNPILRRSPSTWDQKYLAAPSLYYEAGTWYLYYVGYDGQNTALGIARGASLENLEKLAANPILSPDLAASNGWKVSRIGKRSRIIKSEGAYFVAYEAAHQEASQPAHWNIGLARSTNLVNWVNYSGNPLLKISEPATHYDSPELVLFQGKLGLYLRQTDPSATQINRFVLKERPASSTRP